MRTPRGRCRVAAFGVGALIAATIAVTVPSIAAPIAPTFFPTGTAFDSDAYALQFAGANREGTAAAIAIDSALGDVAVAGYPYSYPAVFSKVQPATANSVYGQAACPTTLIVAADDTPADALASAGLRGVAALTLTDVSGSPHPFDTRTIDLLLTGSGREGATDLNVATTAAIAKIKAGCATPGAIVLGGTAAVPAAAATTLKGLVSDVARIAGTTRQDTARLIALAINSAHAPPAVTYYAAAGSPGAVGNGGASLTKAVFLAEDQTGADALAIAALAARQGVPILLTDTATLAPATANALAALSPQHIVVLGGPGAVSDAVIAAAVAAAGTGVTATRVAGGNRYGTSVAIAEQLFNLYPDYVAKLGATAYSGQLWGIARDEGTATLGNHVGWPDALASAFYLAQASTSNQTAPDRLAPPIATSLSTTGSMSTATMLGGGTCSTTTSGPCFANYPLLTTTGATLAPEVDSYLKAIYPASGAYRTGAAPAATNLGGFAFVFGGGASVSAQSLQTLATDLSGGTYTSADNGDLNPSIAAGQLFFTNASLPSSLFQGAATTGPKACVFVGATTDAEGLAGVDEKGQAVTGTAVFTFQGADGFANGVPTGACTSLSVEAAYPGSTDTVSMYGQSLSGHETSPTTIGFGSAKVLTGTAVGPFTPSPQAGDVFGPILVGSSETQTDTYAKEPIPITYKGTSYTTAVATLVLTFTRAKGTLNHDLITFTGTVTAYATAASATPLFTATITKGYSSSVPTTGASAASTLPLVGLYSAPGLGAFTATLAAPSGAPPTSQLSGVTIDGNA